MDVEVKIGPMEKEAQQEQGKTAEQEEQEEHQRVMEAGKAGGEPHSHILAEELGAPTGFGVGSKITKEWDNLTTSGRTYRRNQVLYMAGRLSKSHADEVKLLHYCVDKSEKPKKKEEDVHTDLTALIKTLNATGASTEFQVRLIEKMVHHGFIHVPRNTIAKHLKISKQQYDEILEGITGEQTKMEQ